MYGHLQKFSLRFYQNSSTGDLMSRVVNDIEAMRDMPFHSGHATIAQSLTFVGIATVLFVVNWHSMTRSIRLWAWSARWVSLPWELVGPYDTVANDQWKQRYDNRATVCLFGLP
ncbi:MAG: ABC transporter transmembrane domain-containing protein, partial [Candidatus Poribacteria bacterium]|nr:ABC transporter transmembrane domain-containing protein [Candidatus Poribacteria bacterium]